MIFLRINCLNFIGLAWSRHTKFHTASGATDCQPRSRCSLWLWYTHDSTTAMQYWSAAYLVRRLQSVLNAAARLIYHLRPHDHISDALATLHWLRVPERVQYKIAVLLYLVLVLVLKYIFFRVLVLVLVLACNVLVLVLVLESLVLYWYWHL